MKSIVNKILQEEFDGTYVTQVFPINPTEATINVESKTVTVYFQ
jgi:hypothetical protein